MDNYRQIDYIVTDAKHKWRVQDSYASDELSIGEDRRTVNAVIDLQKKIETAAKDEPNKSPTNKERSWQTNYLLHETFKWHNS